MRNLLLAIAAIAVLAGCSTTEKTQGQGMVSVVAQNVVRIAGNMAIRDLDLNDVANENTHVEVAGFVNEFNSGYVLNLIRDEVENSGGRLASESNATISVEVAVNAAGNDRGKSSYFIGGSERTEGAMDLTVTVRDTHSGEKLSRQVIRGEAKYQQGSLMGFTGGGAYFVRENGDWEKVENPATFK